MEVDKVYCGECSEVMKQIPDESVHMVLTSPPYDNLRTYNEFVFPFEEIAEQIKRVLVPNGVVVWVVGDSTNKQGESGTSFRQALHFQSIGFNIHDTMIYRKRGMPYPEKIRYYSCFEYMFVFSKGGPPRVFNPIQDRRNTYGGTTIKSTNRLADGTIIPSPSRLNNNKIKEFGYRWNIWEYLVGSKVLDEQATKIHPATFPQALAQDHIISWSNPGDIILDPMAGSGTTALMAKKNKRHYIAIEISQEYVDLINYRLDDSRYKDEYGKDLRRNVLW